MVKIVTKHLHQVLVLLWKFIFRMKVLILILEKLSKNIVK